MITNRSINLEGVAAGHNKRAPLDTGHTRCFHIRRQLPGSSEHGR